MAFESMLVRLQDLSPNRRAERPTNRSGPLLEGLDGGVYEEPAFRHFLELERQRALASERPFTLLLVSLRRESSQFTPITEATAKAVFSALRESVRDVDVIGWYRRGLVVGATLPQSLKKPSVLAQRVIVDRVTQMLTSRLDHSAASRIRVRALFIGQ